MILLAAALVLIRVLPGEPAILLARMVTLSYLALRRDYRREIRLNYQRLLGKPSSLFWIKNGWRVGRNLALMAQIGSARGEKLVDRAVVYRENNNSSNDKQDLEQKMHMIMASFHFGLWEFLPSFFANRGYNVGVMVSRQRDATIDYFIRRIRENKGVKYIYSVRDLLFRLSRPGITGFMLDNTSSGTQTKLKLENGVYLQLPSLAFASAQKAGMKVVPIFSYLENGRLKVRLFSPGDELAAINAFVKIVREMPEEWVFWGKSGALAK